MQIVIDKDSMIKIIAIPLYVASGGDYDKATKTANELLEEMGYTELIEVLDKIRAEIDKWHHLTDKAFNDGIDTALEIIDKHIKEYKE